jgi:hypothetical protein
MAWKWLLAGLLAMCLLLGCERPSASDPGKAGGPTTAPANPPRLPATTQSATSSTSPATAPLATTITIEGAINEFPPARLRLDEVDGKVHAILYTDDPEEALRNDYEGNSFYFDLPLEIETAADITAATYDFKATSSDQEDTPEGIFLFGRRWHLQPDDIRIDFRTYSATQAVASGVPDVVTVRIGGTFRMFDTASERTTSAVVPVAGELEARLQRRAR